MQAVDTSSYLYHFLFYFAQRNVASHTLFHPSSKQPNLIDTAVVVVAIVQANNREDILCAVEPDYQCSS